MKRTIRTAVRIIERGASGAIIKTTDALFIPVVTLNRLGAHGADGPTRSAIWRLNHPERVREQQARSNEKRRAGRRARYA